jgi:carbon monoxide dehydrogenase subunit G
MKLEQSFEVAAPIEQVWDALIDIERVAPCLPGASVTGRNEDGSYTGALTIKIGPTTAAYAGKLEMEKIDEGAREAIMQAQGTDKRGQGGAKATIQSNLSQTDSGSTKVDVVTDYHITGRLARFGRGGMIEDISERLLRDFAQCLQSTLVGGQAPSEAPAEQPAAAEAGTAPTATAVAAPGDGPSGDALGEAVGEAARPGEGPAAAPPPPPPPPPPQQPPAQESQPLNAVPLVAGVVTKRAKENPAPIGAVLFGFVLAFVLLRRRRARH